MTPPTKDDVWGSDGSYDRHIGLKDSFLYSFKEIVCEEYDWKEGWEIWEKYNSKEVK